MSTKRNIRLSALVLAVILCAALLSSCGRLSGTYRSQDLISGSFTFNGDKVTMTAFGINAEGTYQIKGDKIIITYELFGSEHSWERPFSKSGDSIYIGGTEFKKV